MERSYPMLIFEYSHYFWPVLERFYFDEKLSTGRLYENPHLDDCGKKLEAALGCNEWTSFYQNGLNGSIMDDQLHVPMPDHIRDKLEMLMTSPYARTLLRALEIKNQKVTDETSIGHSLSLDHKAKAEQA